jgi:ribose transport system substrate-binding protein
MGLREAQSCYPLRRAREAVGMRKTASRVRVPSVVAIGIMAVTMGAAACSSSGSGSGGDASTASPAAAQQSSQCAQTAKAAVQPYEAAPKYQVPAQTINAKPLKGKTIWFISPDQSLSYPLSESQGIQAAGTAAGLHVKIFDGKSQPALFNQGLATAVAQHANGIILNSIDPSLVAGPLAAAKKAGIPVVDAYVGSNPPAAADSPDVFANVTNNFEQTGQIMADYLLSATNCKANVVLFTTSVYPSLQQMSTGISGEMSKVCPGCSLHSITFDPTTIATTVGPLVSNTVRRYPDTNYLIAGFDSLVPYAIPSLQQADNHSPILSEAGDEATYDRIRAGSQVADASLPYGPYAGWLQVDELLRGMAGAQPADDNEPTNIFTKANIGANNSLQVLYPGLVGYQNAFLKDWGLG